MTSPDAISDLELSALISSKICHDVIGPVGAIFNGLEVLEEDDDPGSREYALTVIKDFTTQASSKLQFARFAFGAAGTAGSTIDLRNAEEISRAYVENGKHKLDWQVAPGPMDKDKVKLLLNMIAAAVTALPRGGTMQVAMTDAGSAPSFIIRCSGQAARAPQHLTEFVEEQALALDALTIQPYYTCRLAKAAGMTLGISMEGDDVILAART
ncbi:MAG: histidine phosphotransferase ChpT [Hyphomicrobiaceae bacterium]